MFRYPEHDHPDREGMETARVEVMAMFSEGDGNRLVLRRIRAQASSDTPD
jgi:hypothetical protein